MTHRGSFSAVLIRNFGLFWRRDEVDWSPGKGKRRSFRLLGRRGANLPGLRLADFRYQQGIYILYGQYGPHYVGLTRKQGLGKRLKDHLFDDHWGEWDRFSWFGFQRVLKSYDSAGLLRLGDLADVSLGDPKTMIGDIEALLIKAMGLGSNKAQMNFARAEQWTQVRRHEVEHYTKKWGI
jgi:hypothetical protein